MACCRRSSASANPGSSMARAAAAFSTARYPLRRPENMEGLRISTVASAVSVYARAALLHMAAYTGSAVISYARAQAVTTWPPAPRLIA